MSIKCLIIDDEPLAINVIKNYLNDINDIVIVETFSNAIDGINFLKDNHVDLIFLDINMPVFDGLSFIKSLEKKPLIVITTAYKEYAAETYELDVTDYLVKPISFPRFMKSINKVFRYIEKNKKNNSITKSKRPFVFLRINKKKLQKVYLDEILVVESLKDYLKISTSTERFIIHQTLNLYPTPLMVLKESLPIFSRSFRM